MQIVDYNPQKHYNDALNIFKDNSDMFSSWEIKTLFNELKKKGDNTDKKFVAIDYNQSISGYIEIKKPDDTKHTWEIYWLAVSKKTQRQGIGSKLMEIALEKIKDFGINKVFLDTCSCEGGIAARNFYDKCGFANVGEIPDYYNTGHSKVIFFRRI